MEIDCSGSCTSTFSDDERLIVSNDSGNCVFIVSRS